MKRKSKKLINKVLGFVPYAIFAWVGNRAIFVYRTSPEKDMSKKLENFLMEFVNALTINFLPSFHLYDFLGGLGMVYRLDMK